MSTTTFFRASQCRNICSYAIVLNSYNIAQCCKKLLCKSNLTFPMGLERVYFFGTHEPSFPCYYNAMFCFFQNTVRFAIQLIQGQAGRFQVLYLTKSPRRSFTLTDFFYPARTDLTVFELFFPFLVSILSRHCNDGAAIGFCFIYHQVAQKTESKSVFILETQCHSHIRYRRPILENNLKMADKPQRGQIKIVVKMFLWSGNLYPESSCIFVGFAQKARRVWVLDW